MTARALPAQAPIDDAAWYFHRLWHGLEGWACICVGHNGYYNPAGAYKWGQGGFTQHFYRWPKQRRDLYRFAVDNGQRHDVYAAVALRTQRNREASNAAPSRYLWADIDQEWTDRHQTIWSALRTPGSFAVTSGSGTHRHLYLRLAEPVARDELERLNERLAHKLGGDAKHDAAAVLRVPGTSNRKPVARGQHAASVHVVDLAPREVAQ